MRHIWIAPLLAGFLLGIGPGVRADSLQLKNGNFVQGRYLGGTEGAVQFEANGRVQVYDVHQILSISFGAASADGGVPSKSAEEKPSTNANTNLTANQSTNRTTTVWHQDKDKADVEQLGYTVLPQNKVSNRPCRSTGIEWFRRADSRDADQNPLIQTWIGARPPSGIDLLRN